MFVYCSCERDNINFNALYRGRRTTARRNFFMENRNKRRLHTVRLARLALLTAIVAVLAYYGGFIKIGGFASISLTLIPVVIGAVLCGPLEGAWLGAVAGVMFFATPDAAFWLGLSVPGTVITVMVKGILAGLCAGYAYKLLEKFNRYVAIMASAVVCPVVNTGVFLLGSLAFFMDAVSDGAATEGISVGMYLIVFFVGFNFLFELIANIAVSPAIVRIVDIAGKKRK